MSNVGDTTASSLQTVENAIESTSEGEPALNVNVKSMPDVEIGSIGEDAKQFLNEFANSALVTAISMAIAHSISQSSTEGDAVDLMTLLNDIKEYSRSQNTNVSEINNNLDDLLHKPNASW